MHLRRKLACWMVFLGLFVIRNEGNEPPVIDPISSVTIQESEWAFVPIRISDPDTELTNLVFRGSTQQTSLVESVTFDVHGGTVLATIQTKRGAFGTGTITIEVSDEEHVTSRTFGLTIVEGQPWFQIIGIADHRMNEDEPLRVPFYLILEYVETNDLIFTGNAENTNLISSIEIQPEENHYIARIIPAANAFGSTHITISVSDGNSVARHRFNLDVLPVIDIPHLSIQRGDDYSLAIDSGDPLELYAIEKTRDLNTWELLSTVRLDGDGRAQTVLDRQEPASFVRLRKQ